MKEKVNNRVSKIICIGVMLFFELSFAIGLYRKYCLDTSSSISSWIGEYYFSETTGTNSPNMMMDYKIKVLEGNDEKLYAEIEINGQTTFASIKAEVYGCEEWVGFVFLEYLPDNITGIGTNKGVLLSFRKHYQNIYTYWGEIQPMLYENEMSGRIYFKKLTDVSIQEQDEVNELVENRDKSRTISIENDLLEKIMMFNQGGVTKEE